jgi:hypothetical protein
MALKKLSISLALASFGGEEMNISSKRLTKLDEGFTERDWRKKMPSSKNRRQVYLINGTDCKSVGS